MGPFESLEHPKNNMDVNTNKITVLMEQRFLFIILILLNPKIKNLRLCAVARFVCGGHTPVIRLP